MGYKILAQKWITPNWQDQWQSDEQASKEFFDICSQALAEMATGTAYVLLPKVAANETGKDWFPGTVWADYEWPNIPAGVTVIRINPDDPAYQETIRT
ncbi:uncharacterized protein PG986_004492 [Apiospora aurea]|uniref:Uncharacterized protein n=1 Tax=Apiospora aurea TaxID=335848 RepID=A0ABR1QMR0_9PEZI